MSRIQRTPLRGPLTETHTPNARDIERALSFSCEPRRIYLQMQETRGGLLVPSRKHEGRRSRERLLERGAAPEIKLHFVV